MKKLFTLLATSFVLALVLASTFPTTALADDDCCRNRSQCHSTCNDSFTTCTNICAAGGYGGQQCYDGCTIQFTACGSSCGNICRGVYCAGRAL